MTTNCSAFAAGMQRGLLEYLAYEPAAKNGVRVTLTNDWTLHGRLGAVREDGFTLTVRDGSKYYVMLAAVVAAEIRPVQA